MIKQIVVGMLVIAGAVGLVFAAHRASSASSSSRMLPPKAVPEVVADLDAGPGWSLEIRGVGFTPGAYYQVDIWEMIKEKRDDFASIYSTEADDYPPTKLMRTSYAGINTGAAFRMGATDAVAYWPIPVFAVDPPNLEGLLSWRAADLINEGRNGGGLGVTLFVWQQDANVAHAQQTIADVFTFFDENPQPPLALLAVRDGDVIRNRYRVLGSPGLAEGPVVPTVIDTAATLLLGRTDRVDRYLRPFAPNYRENNQTDKTDLGRLWRFFFKTERASMERYDAELAAKGQPGSPGTMPTADWHAALPTLWSMTDNRGPGTFIPSPWLPIRWAQHQLKEFDRAKHLGHLHRPVKVLLRDGEGQPLSPTLQAKALQEGWHQAVATLPTGMRPLRVFHDSHDGVALEAALGNALHALNTDGQGLDLGHVDQGYDIGRRIGDLGVTSAVVQIGLAAVASYHDGGASAVVYTGEDGSATIQMVRPPSDEEKARNNPPGIDHDPFMRRIR